MIINIFILEKDRKMNTANKKEVVNEMHPLK